jgi:hypothetical protein
MRSLPGTGWISKGADRGDRMAAVKRVAVHCIIKETLQHFQNVQFQIHDKANV